MASPGRLFGLREWRPGANHPNCHHSPVTEWGNCIISRSVRYGRRTVPSISQISLCVPCRDALRIKPPRPQIRAAGTSRLFITPQHDSNFLMIELNSMRLAPFAPPTLQAAMVSVGGPPPCTSPRKAMTLSSSTTSADGTSTTSLAAPPSLPLNLLRLALRHGRR